MSLNDSYFKIDLQDTYTQLNLLPETARHLDFKILSGDILGTYRFKPGSYGLTDMPAEFQKATDTIGLTNTYWSYKDDILVNSSGTLDTNT